MTKTEKKKVLFIVGMNLELEGFMKHATTINPNSLIIQTYGPVISQPYGDLMRDILLAVYQEKVEEIVVVSFNDKQTNSLDTLLEIYQSNKFKKEIQKLDYLFENCKPEFRDKNVLEWLEGGQSTNEAVHNSVNLIREHPLLPAHVKVREMYLEKTNHKFAELRNSAQQVL